MLPGANAVSSGQIKQVLALEEGRAPPGSKERAFGVATDSYEAGLGHGVSLRKVAEGKQLLPKQQGPGGREHVYVPPPLRQDPVPNRGDGWRGQPKKQQAGREAEATSHHGWGTSESDAVKPVLVASSLPLTYSLPPPLNSGTSWADEVENSLDELEAMAATGCAASTGKSGAAAWASLDSCVTAEAWPVPPSPEQPSRQPTSICNATAPRSPFATCMQGSIAAVDAGPEGPKGGHGRRALAERADTADERWPGSLTAQLTAEPCGAHGWQGETRPEEGSCVSRRSSSGYNSDREGCPATPAEPTEKDGGGPGMVQVSGFVVPNLSLRGSSSYGPELAGSPCSPGALRLAAKRRSHGFKGLLQVSSATARSAAEPWGGAGPACVEVVCTANVTPQVRSVVKGVLDGLKALQEPEAASEGLGGTYFFKNADGEKVAILKPCDEEPLAPNNPKGFVGREMGDAGLKPTVRVGEAALREVAAYVLDHQRFAGVPSTVLVRARHPVLHVKNPVKLAPSASCQNLDEIDASPSSRTLRDPAVKLGSLQEFVQHTCDSNEMGASRFPVRDVQHIGILDIRLMNTDRHAGNILVRPRRPSSGGAATLAPLDRLQEQQYELVPIDHGFCLPEALEPPYFEWLHWPQAMMPFGEEELAYIRALDADADCALLQRQMPTLRQESLAILQLSTLLLQLCAGAGLSLCEIGTIMSRPMVGMDDEPSEMEQLCSLALLKMKRQLQQEAPPPPSCKLDADATCEAEEQRSAASGAAESTPMGVRGPGSPGESCAWVDKALSVASVPENEEMMFSLEEESELHRSCAGLRQQIEAMVGLGCPDSSDGGAGGGAPATSPPTLGALIPAEQAVLTAGYSSDSCEPAPQWLQTPVFSSPHKDAAPSRVLSMIGGGIPSRGPRSSSSSRRRLLLAGCMHKSDPHGGNMHWPSPAACDDGGDGDDPHPGGLKGATFQRLCRDSELWQLFLDSFRVELRAGLKSGRWRMKTRQHPVGGTRMSAPVDRLAAA